MSTSYNLENNFWKEFADVKIIDSFQKLYKDDKSRNKEVSSKLMWAIFLVTNPSSNLYNDSNNKSAVAKNFMKNPNFNWDKYEHLIQEYKNCVLSTAEKALVNWNDMMILRDKSLKELYTKSLESGDLTGLKTLDSMLANTAKLFTDYSNIKKQYEEEKTKKKGTKIRSLSDSDLI